MRWLTTITGALATVAAVMVLVAVPPSTESTASATESVPIIETVPVADSSTSTTEPLEIEISGLTPDVADALVRSGHAELVSNRDLIRELPSSVAKALIDADAVLLMPNNGGDS